MFSARRESPRTLTLQRRVSMTTYNHQFCVYLTAYLGNKLPPFYIGSSSIARVSLGYRGSVQSKEYKKIWNLETKKNPHLFRTTIISTHETREQATIKELFFQQSIRAPKNSLYVNRAYAQVTGSHGHAVGLNVTRTKQSIRKGIESKKQFMSTEEGLLYRKNLSEKMTGENNPQFGKTGALSTCYGRTGSLHPNFGKTGNLSPLYGRQSSRETRNLISLNHADVNGANNPRAISWKLTSPLGVEYYCTGNIKTIVLEHNLGMFSLKNNLGSIVPPLPPKSYNKKSKNTVGWKLEKLV